MSTTTVVSQTDSRGSNTYDGGFQLAQDDEHSLHGASDEECDDDDDDGDEDGGDHGGNQKSMKTRRSRLFGNIKQDGDFKDHGQTFLDETVFNRFDKKYRPNLEKALILPGPGDSGAHTLLHYIFDCQEPEEVGILKLQLLIRLILKVAFEEKPESILVRAREGSHAQGGSSCVFFRQILSVRKHDYKETCLHQAVRDQRVDFLKVICHTEGFNGLASALAEAIAIPDLNNQTCLHAAIIGMKTLVTDLDLIQLLVSKSDSGTLSKQRGDDFRNTPLHDFVDAEKCKIWARKCTVPQNKCRKCTKEKRSKRKITDGKAYKEKYMQTLRLLVDQCPDAMVTLNKAHESPYLFNKATRARLPKSNKIWVGLEFTSQHQPAATHASSSAERQDEEKQMAALREHEATNTNQEKHKGLELEYFDDLAVAVARFLLERALSMDDYAKTCTGLLGNLKQLSDPERELKFISTPLTDMTTAIRGYMKLEPILAYVELDLVLEQQPALASAATGAVEDDWARRERNEREKRENRVLGLFEWLRCKGVKRIVKLTVDDHLDLPCQDETIKKCLEGFDIRNLDWNKDDIYVPTLKECAPNLRELWLSWSGRGSTLLGWANKDQGLPTLEHLQAIHMWVRKGLESDRCNGMYIKNFKKLLGNGNPKAPIALKSLADSQRGPLEGGLSTSISQQNDVWTETVKTFRDALLKAVTPEFRKKMRPIRVAVIDDGVSLEEVQSADRFRGWQADPVPLPHKGANAWYYSKNGHGTEMVKIIQRICPCACFFIGKLDIRTRSFKSVAASAAEAINKAIENDCDIITMSWTIYETNGEADRMDIEALDKAVNLAASAKTILYCAGQDQGQYEQSTGKPRPWPASSTTNVLKKIGSTKSFGKAADAVNLRNVDYLFPGTLAHRQSATTSSSAATALAAGVAALILWCAEVCRVRGVERESGLREKPAARASTLNFGSLNTAAASEGYQPSSTMEYTGKLVPYFNFREDQRMNTLFDKLRSDQNSASLVDVTSILDTAAKEGRDCPGMVVKLCQDKLQ